MTTENRPNYLDLVAKHVEGLDLSAGSVVHVEVRHEDRCGIFDGRSCNCSPTVETGSRVQRKYGGEPA